MADNFTFNDLPSYSQGFPLNAAEFNSKITATQEILTSLKDYVNARKGGVLDEGDSLEKIFDKIKNLVGTAVRVYTSVSDTQYINRGVFIKTGTWHFTNATIIGGPSFSGNLLASGSLFTLDIPNNHYIRVFFASDVGNATRPVFFSLDGNDWRDLLNNLDIVTSLNSLVANLSDTTVVSANVIYQMRDEYSDLLGFERKTIKTNFNFDGPFTDAANDESRFIIEKSGSYVFEVSDSITNLPAEISSDNFSTTGVFLNIVSRDNNLVYIYQKLQGLLSTDSSYERLLFRSHSSLTTALVSSPPWRKINTDLIVSDIYNADVPRSNAILSETGAKAIVTYLNLLITTNSALYLPKNKVKTYVGTGTNSNNRGVAGSTSTSEVPSMDYIRDMYFQMLDNVYSTFFFGYRVAWAGPGWGNVAFRLVSDLPSNLGFRLDNNSNSLESITITSSIYNTVTAYSIFGLKNSRAIPSNFTNVIIVYTTHLNVSFINSSGSINSRLLYKSFPSSLFFVANDTNFYTTIRLNINSNSLFAIRVQKDGNPSDPYLIAGINDRFSGVFGDWRIRAILWN